jgi:hypothetical protein
MSERPAITAMQEFPEIHTSWPSHWKAQRIPWRTESVISAERQAHLAGRRAIAPHIEQGLYFFKGVEPKLTRDDIEWLLTAHESRGVGGVVLWEQEKDKLNYQRRQGLDLRDSALFGLDLSRLPLASARAGLTSTDSHESISAENQNAAAAQLQRANLFAAQVEKAKLSEARFKRAILFGAHLNEANLHIAYLEHATNFAMPWTIIALGSQQKRRRESRPSIPARSPRA